MLVSFTRDGHALNIVEKAKDDNGSVEHGFTAWTALNTWYLDQLQVNQVISNYETLIEALVLVCDQTATEYINHFEIYTQKLGKLEKAPWSDKKRVRDFKKGVTDLD